jgi:hypothetical protein
MIPRLNLAPLRRPHAPSWPPQTSTQTPLFVGRPAFRKLVVLADAAVIDGFDIGEWSPALLLAGLLSHDFIECYRYSDDGPPPDAKRHRIEPMGEVVPGWAVLSSVDPASNIYGVRVGGLKWLRDSGIMGNRTEIAAQDSRTPVYSDMDPKDAGQRRRLDALAAQVAESVHADLFVTDRPYVHAVEWVLAQGVTCFRPDQAFPIVSLYLRAQGEFITYRVADGTATEMMNRGLFFWVGTRELLSSAWRWFNACAQYSATQNDDTLLLLGQSVLMRFTRALQMRDQMHIALNQPQDNDIADDALSALDVILLLLMGAVDASARVTHHVLQIPGTPRNASWHRDHAWRRDVVRSIPRF